MMNMLVALNLGSYLMMLMFFTYACIIADTRKSRLAFLFQIVLPAKCSNLSKKILGESIFDFLTGSEDRFLNWLYICIVFSSWIVIFVYTYPWIDASDGYIPSYHKFLGYGTFLSCVASWRLAATKSPGIITAQTIERYDNYPYDGNLYIRGRICPTVGIPKIARSKFDRITGVHVAKFDHFCGWLGNSIGEENYRWFLLFLFIHTGMLCYGTVLVVALFKHEIEKNQLWDMMYVDGFTGEQRKATSFIVFQYIFLRHRLHMALLFMFAALSIVLFGFLLFHIWITSRGMTTNEAFKWKKIRKSYRLQLLQYEDQIEKRRLMKNAHPNDINGSAKGLANVETKEVNHPGPMPQNIYNGGILSNWMDVFFPRSISSKVSQNQLFHLKRNEDKQF
jgi:palmitoyltransferase ZDHHC4